MIRRKVIKGTGTGKKIGYPTLNFNVGNFGKCCSQGVYKCEVFIRDKCYSGALFFGPRMGGTKALEIYVVELKGNVYGEYVTFKVGKKIRNSKTFSNLNDLKKQIKKDISLI
jgi:riboflavin kinase/FMN adenylyltransferase